MVNKNMKQDHPKSWGMGCPGCQLPTLPIQMDELIPKGGFGNISHWGGAHDMPKTQFPCMTKLRCFSSLGYNTSLGGCFCSLKEQGNTSRSYFHWYIPMILWFGSNTWMFAIFTLLLHCNRLYCVLGGFKDTRKTCLYGQTIQNG